MQDRVLDLAQRREKLVTALSGDDSQLRSFISQELKQVEVALVGELKTLSSSVSTATPKIRKPRVASTNGTASPSPDGSGKKTMKDVVLGVLSSAGNGLSLSEVVAEVSKMIQAGEYHTKSEGKGVTANVSQALHGLTKENLARREQIPLPDDKMKNVYVLNTAA